MEKTTLSCLKVVNPESMRKMVGGDVMDQSAHVWISYLTLASLERKLWRDVRRPCAYVAISVTYGVNPKLRIPLRR